MWKKTRRLALNDVRNGTAQHGGRSAPDLRKAVKESDLAVSKLGSRFAARFRKIGMTADLPVLRGQRVRAIDPAA
jgi:hypothetical protein